MKRNNGDKATGRLAQLTNAHSDDAPRPAATAAPAGAVLPLLAFQHHVGSQMYVDPEDIDFIASIGIGDLALVELGRWRRPNEPQRAKPLQVVVKGYKPHVVSSPQDFRELLLEAAKLQRLQHP
jgi:hypothetical protein